MTNAKQVTSKNIIVKISKTTVNQIQKKIFHITSKDATMRPKDNISLESMDAKKLNK